MSSRRARKDEGPPFHLLDYDPTRALPDLNARYESNLVSRQAFDAESRRILKGGEPRTGQTPKSSSHFPLSHFSPCQPPPPSRTIASRPHRISDMGAHMIDRIQYGYDPSGNRTWRKNLAAEEGGQDNAYRHDGLYQVTESALGTLNLNQSAIGAIPSEEEAFAYDPSGNWTHFTKRADGAPVIDQSRVSNRDN